MDKDRGRRRWKSKRGWKTFSPLKQNLWTGIGRERRLKLSQGYAKRRNEDERARKRVKI